MIQAPNNVAAYGRRRALAPSTVRHRYRPGLRTNYTAGQANSRTGHRLPSEVPSGDQET